MQKESLTEEEERDLQGLMFRPSSYVGITGRYIFASDGALPNYYIEKSEIGSGECEWKRIGYDGEMNETAQTD